MKGGAPSRLSRFRRHRLAAASAVFALLLAAACLAAPLLGTLLGADAETVDLATRFAGPSAAHLLGTDELGRDVLLRLLYGGRVSLFVGVTTALTAAALGTVIGLLAGYYGGVADRVLMRLTDGVIALPLLPLLIVLAAADPAKLGLPAAVLRSPLLDLFRIVAIVALVGWTTVARLVRGATLSLREREFVLAARALGASGLRIMTVHLLPNLLAPVVVATALSTGAVILAESVLSFLGLGIQPPIPSWGNLLTNAQQTLWEAPALAVYPGLLIFATVAACNLIADALQAALNPSPGERRG
ncbi:MAG: ABC transporter permease [Deltaproteobacteria bacterium]|nr:ABC transporter permease [Deltaproteobacteria bacterium]